MTTLIKSCIIGTLLFLAGNNSHAAFVANRYDTNTDAIAAGLVQLSVQTNNTFNPSGGTATVNGNLNATGLGGNVVNTNFFNCFTRYIDAGVAGNDTNKGGINDPWATIGKANANVAPGITMYVRAGSYSQAISNLISPWYLERGVVVPLFVNASCTNGLVDGFGIVTNISFAFGLTTSNLTVNGTSIYTGTDLSAASSGSYPTAGNINLNANFILLQWRPGQQGDAAIYALANEMVVSNFTQEEDGTPASFFDIKAHHMTIFHSDQTYGILGYNNSKIIADSADLTTNLVIGEPDTGFTRIVWQVGHTYFNGHTLTFGNNMTFVNSPAFTGTPALGIGATWSGTLQMNIP